jgi:hypothetical protein
VRRIVLVLDHVETQHARLGERRLRIDLRGGQELRDLFGPDAGVNMNGKHVLILLYAGRRTMRADPPCWEEGGPARFGGGTGTVSHAALRTNVTPSSEAKHWALVRFYHGFI